MPTIWPLGPNLDTTKTPQGDVTFHGPFTRIKLLRRLPAGHLDPHVFLDIQFDLLIIHSWDGSVDMSKGTQPAPIGPDFFKLMLRDGPTLLYTTFSNRPDDNGFDARSKFQNFPSPVPGDHFDPQTGAAAKNSLGYNYPWPGAPWAFPMDATYHIHLIVPHDAAQAVLRMSGIGLQNIIDESWGVTNLQVQALGAEKVKKPDLDSIAGAFKAALDIDGKDQQEAMQTLVLGMDDTVTWIQTNVTPQPVDGDKVQQLIKDLGSDDSGIDARESASSALRGMGPAVEPLLRDAQKSATGELRLRLEWELEAIGVTPTQNEDLRRVALAERVLEIIGTPKALELRKSLIHQ